MNEIKDHILLMLGAPVVKVELDEKQLDHCVEVATRAIDNLRTASHKLMSDSRVEELTKQYALGNSMIILGHIRGKYKIPNCEGLDAEYLRDRGYELLIEVREEFSYNREEFMNVFLTLLSNPQNDPLFVKNTTIEILKQLG